MSKQDQELKQAYAEELKKVWGKDQKMVDYCLGKAQRIVRLSDGSLYIIEKQGIKTRFCYGYGLNGVTNEEEEENACAMARQAKTKEDYFIAENMEGFSPFDFSSAKWYRPVLGQAYYVPTNIRALAWKNYSAIVEEGLELLSAEDEAILRNAYEEEKAVHLKKVQTYLKRYGLSKVHSWTYLVD